MEPWDCCRTCLSNDNLFSINNINENNEKFADVVYLAIGMKIEPSDKLSNLMCSSCINFVKEISKFRKKAEYAQKELLERLKSKQYNNIKPLTFLILKTEKEVPTFDNYEDSNHEYNDDDDVPLCNLQYHMKLEIDKGKTEFESPVKEAYVVYKPNLTLKCESKKKNSTEKKNTKRKVRNKKERSGEKQSCNEKKGGKEEIECEYCHKILTSKLSMRNHYKIHTGFDFVCEHCGKKFITRRLLLMHCRAKHGYEKTDKCSYCDYKASNAEQVKIHERLHTGEKPYVCSECGAGFHRKSSYLQHIAIHLPEKTVQCDSCPARFKSVTLMRIHRSRHRPAACRFGCRLCGRSFARRRNVARHLAAVHAVVPESDHIQRIKI